MAYTRFVVQRVHRQDRQPLVLYFHPWELDPDQPRIIAKWKSRFRHYTGLSRMESRIRELLSTGSFISMIDWISHLPASLDTIPLAPFAAHSDPMQPPV
jgi:hypothetical protein